MFSKVSMQSKWLKLRKLANANLCQGKRSFAVKEYISSEDKVIDEKLSDHVKQFTLNSPKTLNALDMDMIEIMWNKLTEWHKHPESAPRVLFMKGAGEKAF